MVNKSKVTAEQTMPTGRGRGERRARNTRPQRRAAVQVVHERTETTEVQIQGGSHDHDDRYPRIGRDARFSRVTGDAVFGDDMHISRTAHINNLIVTGNKNAMIRGTEHGDLYFAATEADRARFWVYIKATDSESPADILAKLPPEFTSVTQEPYWIAFETGYQLDGTDLGTWARVTADVRDDLGPQQSAFGKGM